MERETVMETDREPDEDGYGEVNTIMGMDTETETGAETEVGKGTGMPMEMGAGTKAGVEWEWKQKQDQEWEMNMGMGMEMEMAPMTIVGARYFLWFSLPFLLTNILLFSVVGYSYVSRRQWRNDTDTTTAGNCLQSG
jgi:hypothetical protein